MVWGETLIQSKWQNHVSHLTRQPELIQQLLPYHQLLIIAGQFGIGKTSELLHLMHCFSYGASWHGLKVEPSVSLYITWEGEPVRLNDRIKKIDAQYAKLGQKYPWYIRMELKKIPLDTEEGQEKLKSLIAELDPMPRVVFLDPFKRSVHGDYTKPGVADLWIQGASAICRELKCAIVTANHTNKIIFKKNDPPDVLGADRVKGAADLLDGVSASLLIAEEKGYKRVVRSDGFAKNEWTTFSFVFKILKAKDATAGFPLLFLQFDRKLLRLAGEEWKVKEDGEILAEHEDS